MEKIAFVMTLKPGYEAEYKKTSRRTVARLSRWIKKRRYFWLLYLFASAIAEIIAVLKRTDNHTMDNLPVTAAVKKWWAFMADIMETNPDNSPVVESLEQVFHFE